MADVHLSQQFCRGSRQPHHFWVGVRNFRERSKDSVPDEDAYGIIRNNGKRSLSGLIRSGCTGCLSNQAAKNVQSKHGQWHTLGRFRLNS